jgi:hypothetical protein
MSEKKRKLSSLISYEDILRCLSSSSSLFSCLSSLQSLFLSSGSSYEEIIEILCSSLLMEQLSLSFYWLIHLKGIISFSSYLQRINQKKLIKLLKDSWNEQEKRQEREKEREKEREREGGRQVEQEEQGNNLIQKEIFNSILNYIFNECLDSNQSMEYSIKMTNILEEFCLNSSIMTYPYHVQRENIQMIMTVFAAIQSHYSLDDVKKFYSKILLRLFACVYSYPFITFDSTFHELNHNSVCNGSFDADVQILNEFISYFDQPLLLSTLSLSIFHESYSVFDSQTYLSLTYSIKPCTTPFLFILLPAYDEHSPFPYSITKPFSSHFPVERLLQIFTGDTIFESVSIQGNLTPFLRIMCLLEIVGGSALISSWFKQYFPSDANTNSLTFSGSNSDALKPTIFSQMCLSLCTILPILKEDSIRYLCQLLRSKLSQFSLDIHSSQCKESFESFLQIANLQILQSLALQQSIFQASLPQSWMRTRQQNLTELTPARLHSWAMAVQQTGQLPIAVIQLCSFLGHSAYKKVFSTMLSLLSTDATLKPSCEMIIKGMKEHKPPLCPIKETNEFLEYLKGNYASSALDTKLADLIQFISADNQTKIDGKIRNCLRIILSMKEYLSSADSSINSEPPESKGSGVLTVNEITEWEYQWKISCVAAISDLRSKVFVNSSTSTPRSRFIMVLNLAILQVAEVIYQRLGALDPSRWNLPCILQLINGESQPFTLDSPHVWLLHLGRALLAIYHLDTNYPSLQCRDEMISGLLSLVNTHFVLKSNSGCIIDSRNDSQISCSTLLTSAFLISLLQSNVSSYFFQFIESAG